MRTGSGLGHIRAAWPWPWVRARALSQAAGAEAVVASVAVSIITCDFGPILRMSKGLLFDESKSVTVRSVRLILAEEMSDGWGLRSRARGREWGRPGWRTCVRLGIAGTEEEVWQHGVVPHCSALVGSVTVWVFTGGGRAKRNTC